MAKKIFQVIILCIIFFGIACGVYVFMGKNNEKKHEEEKIASVFENMQNTKATATKVYTYGDTLSVSGTLNNISKDNFESAKLVITDGENETICSLETSIEDNVLTFSTEQINNAIELDELDEGQYYVLLRVKVNNSAVAKYYGFSNLSELEAIEYYTVTRNEKNNKINIEFVTTEYNEKEYEYISVSVAESELPDEVYDFVIDAGHGGKDTGESKNGYTEAGIALDYAKDLKSRLEELGLKVKLTRDDENSASYTYTNMYDSDGRITIACSTRAKYMLSFHVNSGNSYLSGLEIYAPTKSNLTFAKLMAQRIVESGAIEYSNNTGFKRADGVFVWNFTASVIKDFESTANRKGYEPYPITTDTPYQYTIREVGGVATGAYVDGRNTDYSANEYYDSVQGIECYQIELGYIDTDLEKILYNREAYITSLVQAIQEYLEL